VNFGKRCKAVITLLLVVLIPAVSVAETADTASIETSIQTMIASSDHPLINPDRTENGELTIASQPDEIHILLLGIDDQQKNYTYRKEVAHTDAILLLSVNLKADADQEPIKLISIPRDIIAYVPGVKGIYKINDAINCGDALAVGANRADAENVVNESETGFLTVCKTVSWLLGGVPIDYYCGITMDSMAALGNLIGGVDYDLEMSFTGHDGVYHKKGQQHLDGNAIVDYFRARKNATVETGSDQARAGRQRDMMEAILSKFISDKTLMLKAFVGLQSNQKISKGFYTNLDAAAFAKLMSAGVKLLENWNGSGDQFGSYSLEGDYLVAFGNWKFRFPDQDHRAQVLKEAFGVEAPALRYVSSGYADWLYKTGFKAVRRLGVADDLRVFIATHYQYTSPLVSSTVENTDQIALTQEQVSAIAAFDQAYADTLRCFLAASDAADQAAMKGEKTGDEALETTMESAYKALQTSGDALAQLVGYPAGIGKKVKKVEWNSGVYMDEDPMINGIYVNFR
jgi:LCP family protein required for cell wall assembly